MRKLAIIPALILCLFAAGCYEKPEAGEMGVVRNGGPFDNTQIKKVLCPGVNTQNVGLNSSARYYPHDQVQRYYTITSDPTRSDSGAADRVEVPSADGISLVIEGQILFTTSFNCTPQGIERIKEFDTRYGTRKFPVLGGGGEKAVWEGTEGWAAFLDSIMRPIIENELRQGIGEFACSDLYSSCAYVSSGGNVSFNKPIQGKATNSNLQLAQERIARGLEAEFLDNIGPYFAGIKFNLTSVHPPAAIQQAINEAQAQFANVAKTQAIVDQATKQAQAARKLAQVYQDSPQLAEIRKLEILCGTTAAKSDTGGCKGATVILGANAGVNVNTGGSK